MYLHEVMENVTLNDLVYWQALRRLERSEKSNTDRHAKVVEEAQKKRK